jgi:hypothetical protein
MILSLAVSEPSEPLPRLNPANRPAQSPAHDELDHADCVRCDWCDAEFSSRPEDQPTMRQRRVVSSVPSRRDRHV